MAKELATFASIFKAFNTGPNTSKYPTKAEIVALGLIVPDSYQDSQLVALEDITVGMKTWVFKATQPFVVATPGYISSYELFPTYNGITLIAQGRSSSDSISFGLEVRDMVQSVEKPTTRPITGTSITIRLGVRSSLRSLKLYQGSSTFGTPFHTGTTNGATTYYNIPYEARYFSWQIVG